MNPKSEFKYIMFDIGVVGTPVLFPSCFGHGMMYDALKEHIVDEVLSAGYVSIDDGIVNCYAQSMDLDKEPRDIDDSVIRDYLSSSPNAL